MAETRVGGARIRYDDVGQGEPTLLFIPGWCTSREVFRKLAPWSSILHRALVVDLPGHGESQQPGPGFDNTTVVDTLRAVIDASGARQVVPVALSHGGWWALELRRQLGPRIPALVLLDWLVLEPPPPFLQALKALQSPQWKQARDGLFSLWLQGVSSPDVIRFVRDDMGSFGEDMWKRAGREIEQVYTRSGSPLEALSTLSPPVPTLHLYSQPEDSAWLDAQRSFASSHPWFQVQKLPARSHFPMLELPEEMAARIGRFLDAALATHPGGLAPPPT
ncbi:pimeloyl-ACP methyl ester carboxylesterase [Archangium gephyra]|uniref:1H-3-hydroxy-4-oxoquinaldine 2,4-dioxygenase n=1 Tax=Archangium gephyra TaxID=48 RepID=A0AAC8Q136_9BACT|nr:alpha/beta hydrolase [Archangium gephyra]AKI98945.1 1H-3-hydroxy-4-oxoquinaldine 2,4-dioxygenase [Archangium gephyra]REG30855.1 pimeloyl-ACP methyl ester carboxylesterase [Archangium gephyra]